MKFSAELVRAQDVSNYVLAILSCADGAAIGGNASFETIYQELTTSKTLADVSDSQLRRTLNDLCDREMAGKDFDKEGRTWRFRILPRGRDFVRADCPWKMVNEFHPLRTVKQSRD